MGHLKEPPSETYDDDVLYGARREAIKRVENFKLHNNSEAVIYTLGTFSPKDKWELKNLDLTDKRTRSLVDSLNITCALPVQRHCWPLMDRATFPFVCVAPESSGKTFCHLLYIVTKLITQISSKRSDKIIAYHQPAISDELLHPIRSAPLETESEPAQEATDDLCVDQNDFDFNSLGKKPQEEIQSHKSERELQETETSAEKQANNNESVWFRSCQEDCDEYSLSDHPKCVIICSNQVHVERLKAEVNQMKVAAYGVKLPNTACKVLSPIVEILSPHHDDGKLALKCAGSEVLITTPAMLVKCCRLNYIDFSKCSTLLFDDVDLTLQLHNNYVHELIKLYLAQTQVRETSGAPPVERALCQAFFFSRKWTNLLKQFVNTAFVQKDLVFGSIIEASLYIDTRFDFEFLNGDDIKAQKLSEILKCDLGQIRNEKLAVLCKDDAEAQRVSNFLISAGHSVRYISEETAVPDFQMKKASSQRRFVKPIYVMSDATLEFLFEQITDITHLIHYSLPCDSNVFDQRFRIMYRNIQDCRRNLNSTVLADDSLNLDYAKKLYDIVARSGSALPSARLSIRDYINERSTTICWRWASMGLCRLEKLSQEDRLGSFCPFRHSLIDKRTRLEEFSLPASGQFKITITHLVSPSEFYFRFEAYRNIESISRQWTKIERSGTEFMGELQKRLNLLKDNPSCSIALESFKRGKVYGIYNHQDVRVDRIRIISELPQFYLDVRKKNAQSQQSIILRQLEYSKQVEVLRIDYGVVICAYLRNIFELPECLSSVQPQCHRGFHLGVKPTGNEPNWSYKSTKFFQDQIQVENLHETTVWLRLNSSNCFWFEGMVVRKKVPGINDDRFISSEPHKCLCKSQLAVTTGLSPPCLDPPKMHEALSKWHTDDLKSAVRFAHLRRDKLLLNIYILSVDKELRMFVRQVNFNQQLANLEDDMKRDFSEGNLSRLHYFAPDIYCLVKVVTGTDPKHIDYVINRCKIISIISEGQDDNDLDNARIYRVFCVDHGDYLNVCESDLYLAQLTHITRLPFQAVLCDLSSIDSERIKGGEQRQVQELLYSYSRDDENENIMLQCTFDSENKLYIYVPDGKGTSTPLINLLEKKHGLFVFNNQDESLRLPLKEKWIGSPNEIAVKLTIKEIIRDMVKDELSKVGVDISDSEGSDSDLDVTRFSDELSNRLRVA